MRSLLIALQFLTIIPIRLRRALDDAELAESAAWFPVVGAVLGLLLVLGYWLFTRLFQPSLADALTVFLLALLSGGLHLDGVADLFDGLGARKGKAETLYIMKDSRIGAFGAMALFIVLTLKIMALSLVENEHKVFAIFFMPVVGRWSQLFLVSFGSYAKEEGTAGPFFGHARQGAFWIGSLAPVLLLAEGLRTFSLAAMAANLVFCWLFMKWMQFKLGGQTGDTLGAATEFSEVLFLLLVDGFHKAGWLWPNSLF